MPELKDKIFPTWYVLGLWQDKISVLWDDVNIQEASHELEELNPFTVVLIIWMLKVELWGSRRIRSNDWFEESI